MEVLADGTIILPDGRKISPGALNVEMAATVFDASWTAEEAWKNGFVLVAPSIHLKIIINLYFLHTVFIVVVFIVVRISFS